MRWFRRTDADRPPPPVDPPDPHAMLDELDRLINRGAAGLPGWAVVQSRWISDTLRAIIGAPPWETSIVLLVTGTAGDYLPTTLRGYLAVDEEARTRPRGDGRTPEDHLHDQLADLHTAATSTLAAVRDRDTDAMRTQSSFLRTKFTRSDLDLP